jgi:8-oxo-dGTP pyrophosphatase MutT (NUDIX family)
LKLEFNFSQSAVIPYRIKNGKAEVLLITSIKKKRWIIPKGYIEFNHTPYESAKKEAYEEAGVIGTNETIEIGAFKTTKQMGVCFVRVFSMEVESVLDEYPEMNLRKRKWFELKEAARQVNIPEISNLILSLENKLNFNK